MTTLATTVTLLLSFLLVTGNDDFDWCSHDCTSPYNPTEKHTMCIYPAGGGEECREWKRGLVTKEKKLILDLHNELRQKVANGQETTGLDGPQPSAADMMRLVWDSELETVAQRWAEQCQKEGHDLCRIAKDGEEVGQNEAGMEGQGQTQLDRMQMLKAMVESWYSEVKDFPVADVNSVFATSRKPVGHYTQVVWGATTRIGCGFILLHQVDKRVPSFKVKFLCNYKTAGNWKYDPVYTQGEPASSCPPDTTPSQTYQGLCESSDKGTPLVIEGDKAAESQTTVNVQETQPEKVENSIDVTTERPMPPSKPQEEKKPSFLWRVITLPWRILKWILSIPSKIVNYFRK